MTSKIRSEMGSCWRVTFDHGRSSDSFVGKTLSSSPGLVLAGPSASTSRREITGCFRDFQAPSVLLGCVRESWGCRMRYPVTHSNRVYV